MSQRVGPFRAHQPAALDSTIPHLRLRGHIQHYNNHVGIHNVRFGIQILSPTSTGHCLDTLAHYASSNRTLTSSMTCSLNIIIVGAGLSGLSAAIACARGGHAVLVIEAAKELAEVSGTAYKTTVSHMHRLEQDYRSRQMAASCSKNGAFSRSCGTKQLSRPFWQLGGTPMVQSSRGQMTSISTCGVSTMRHSGTYIEWICR